MATLITIVTLLVFLSSLETTVSRNTPYQNENSLRRDQTRREASEKECELRRPDGTCHNQWRVKRQAKCDRRKSPNCRVMIGKKRAPLRIDCTQSEARRSLFCRNEYFKRLNTNTPCEKLSAKCEKLYMYKSALKSADLKKKTQKCNLKSPLCYVPFPGKRKPKHDRKNLEKRVRSEKVEEEFGNEDSVTVTENDLLKELLVARRTTKLPYELSEGEKQKVGFVPTVAEDNDNSKPTCDPKRDYQCRFRIFAGKRDQTFNKPTYQESYKYN